MLRRLIEEVKQEAIEKDKELNSNEMLLIIDDIAFDELKSENFKSKIVSDSDWRWEAPSLSEKYKRENIHIVRFKNIFEKANIDQDGYFVYKNEIWKTLPYLDGVVAKESENGSCCTFEEGHCDEDWIKSEELTPIDSSKLAILMKENLDKIIKDK